MHIRTLYIMIGLLVMPMETDAQGLKDVLGKIFLVAVAL